MEARPGDIAGTYERQAATFAAQRGPNFPDIAVFRLLLRHLRGREALDLGCGTGRPVAVWLAAHGLRVTGIDGSAAMIALFAQALPRHPARRADMRRLHLGRRFDAVIAWDSFFHLPPRDQRAMLATFRRHTRPGALVLFNTGPRQGRALGRVGIEQVWHGSLAPADYRRLLALNGLRLIACRLRDPKAAGRSWWLARRMPLPSRRHCP